MPVKAMEGDASVVEVLCPNCDYNLNGVAGERCPSCGWLINYQVLMAQARVDRSGRRYAVAFTAFVVGVAALFALASLAARGRRLNLSDGFIVLSVAIASAGHLGLSIIAAMPQRRWPMRQGAAADLLLFAASASILLGLAGATQFYDGLPARRMVRGVEVSGVLEFLVAAMLLFMPGSMLLILRLVSFGDRLEPAPRAKEHAGSSLPVRAAFGVDFFQRFTLTQVTTQWTDFARTTSPAIERRIEEAWATQTALAAESNRTLYDGRLVRLVGVERGDQRLRLILGPTSFREFLGTNLYHAAATVQEDASELANAVGVSAIVVCRDHVLTFGRRSQNVAFHAGYLHTFGGMIERSELAADNACDVFAVMARELVEEAGVRADEIAGITLVGMVRDRELLQPELIFEVILRIDSAIVRSRFEPGGPAQEHSGLEFVFEDPDAVLPFLRRASPVAPVAEAALLLHGRRVFGDEWYEQTCYVLYGELPPATAVAGRVQHG